MQKLYDGAYAEEGVVPEFLAKRLDEIVAGFASSRRTGRLLDVGFGGGELLHAARRAGWDVSGVELAAPAVERARRHGFNAFQGTLANAAYEPDSFDVVLAVELLEHVIETGALLTEIHRVLRPGGLLWATTPHGRGISSRILGASWSVVSPPGHVQLFSIRGLKQLFRRAGFPTVSIAAEGVNPYEILRYLRGTKTAAAQRMDTAYSLNAFFEARPGRRALKRAINAFLSTLRLGDSLKISARKPEL